ncbi:hypothetical protein F2Q70_00000205 [Brassica cretica]|uniref:Uncharacterized protein n=1 Tax=Brassica cretica TaxID=69181 RepID=A0A8S9IR03_BRACR|nr:hypothetical protein F2Q70_00000205 [Brassica cretica]
MSFTSSSSGSAPVNLNSSSKGYQFVSTAPIVYQKKNIRQKTQRQEMEAVQLMLRTPSMNGIFTIHPETATLFLVLGLLLYQ